MNFNLQQNRVIVASAGTGKTHTLVGMICHALLGASGLPKPVRPEAIVATTFSRKAREEIVERLERELKTLALDPPKSPYASMLEQVPERVVRSRAIELVRSGVQKVRIDTFHGLAYRMLQDHPGTFGPPPSAILDETEQTRIRMQAVDLSLEQLSASDFAACMALSRGARNLDALRLWLRFELERLDELAVTSLVPRDDAADIEQLVFEFHALLTSLPKPEGSTLGASLLRAWRAQDMQSWALGALEVNTLKLGKKVPEEEALSAFLASFEGQTKHSRLTNFIELVERRAAFGHLAKLARDLVSHTLSVMDERVRELEVVTFAEIQRRLRAGLLEQPETARALGEAIELMVVDEFQDTSPIQGDLVCLLRAEPHVLRHNYVPKISEVRKRGLVIVGDRKQSIYGFRGADARLFAKFCVGLAGEPARSALGLSGRATSDTPSASLEALQVSRRSSAPLLRSINAFCLEHFAGAASEFEVAYAPAAEDLLPHAGTRSEGVVLWHRIANRTKGASTRRDEALGIRDMVVHIHEGRTVLGPRPFRSMAVLAQSHATLEAVAFELSLAGIPHVSGDMRIYSTREVRDLRALLAVMQSRLATLPLLEVLRGPCVGLEDEQLLALAPQIRKGEVPLVLPEGECFALTRWNHVYGELAPLASKLGPYRLLKLLIHALDLQNVWLQLPRGEERLRMVEHALEALRSVPSIERAIQFLDTSKQAQKRAVVPFSDDQDGVRLLTVHASKGLSFPIVLLPDVARRPRSEVRSFATLKADSDVAELGVRMRGRHGEWLSPPQAAADFEVRKERASAERKRIWYVALTRAEEGLVFVGDAKSPQGIVSTLSLLAMQSLVTEVTPKSVDPAPSLEAPLLVPIASAPARPVKRLRLSPTALSDFYHCARRFQLVHTLDIAEEKPVFSAAASDVDARLEGTLAHQVLEQLPVDVFGTKGQLRSRAFPELDSLAPQARERVLTLVERFVESEYAEGLAGAEVLRELPFRLTVTSARGTALLVSGVMDLVVRYPNAPQRVDVIDYKRSRGPDPHAHAFQLAVYARAARLRFDDAPVRAGVVFLGAKGEPDFIDASPIPDGTLERLADAFVEARTEGDFPRASRETCRAIRCGYQPRCYG